MYKARKEYKKSRQIAPKKQQTKQVAKLLSANGWA